MDDLVEFGMVQRGLLGIQIRDVDASVAENYNLKVNQGVLVDHVNRESAAEKAGIVNGDVIIGIEGHIINSVSELQEWVARNRPGKEITVSYIRDGVTKDVKARLRNFQGLETVEKKSVKHDFGGVQIEDVPYKELATLQLEGGVRVKEVVSSKWLQTGIKKGFVIAYIDKVPVDNVEDLNRILDYKKGGILIEGYYPGGQKGTYGVEW